MVTRLRRGKYILRTSKPPSRIERGGNFTIKNFPPPYSLLSSETTLAVRRRGLVPPLPIISHTVASSFFRYKTQSKLRTPNPNLLFPFSVCCPLFLQLPIAKTWDLPREQKTPTPFTVPRQRSQQTDSSLHPKPKPVRFSSLALSRCQHGDGHRCFFADGETRHTHSSP